MIRQTTQCCAALVASRLSISQGESQLKRSANYLTASLTLVAAISATAMYWVHISHTRQLPEGRVLLLLWGTHGIHSLDLVVLVAEILLVALLCIVLLAGFSRRNSS